MFQNDRNSRTLSRADLSGFSESLYLMERNDSASPVLLFSSGNHRSPPAYEAPSCQLDKCSPCHTPACDELENHRPGDTWAPVGM